MTPKALLERIVNGPTDQLVAELGALDEKERKKLAKTVVEFRKNSTASAANPFAAVVVHLAEAGLSGVSEFNVQALNRARGQFFAQDHSLVAVRFKLALLAVGPWAEAQRIRASHVAGFGLGQGANREHLFCVLRDRRPDWLGKWVEKELDERMMPDWPLVRRLVRAGLCPRPEGENYILGMLQSQLWSRPEHGATLKDALLDDPDLLAWEVWKIFELSPVRETILWRHDAGTTDSWGGALRALAGEGKIDRNRLLSASLGGLSRNAEARNTAWFASFHELLEPTDNERPALQPTYLQLLAHRVPAVVGLALTALARVEKAHELDVAGFLQAVPAVFYLQPKAQPLAALRISGRLCLQDPGQQAMLAEALLASLMHPAADVQQRAIELLEKLGNGAAQVIRVSLPERLEQIAPSVQERARQLLRTLNPEAESARQPERVVSHDALMEQARLLPARWREQAGIDTVLQALETGADLPPLAFDPMSVPRLYAANRLVPIQTLDELIDRLIVAVTKLDSGIEFELLLDGLSRLCDQRPPDFQDRVAPIPHAFWNTVQHEPWATIEMVGLRAPLHKLVCRWSGAAFQGPAPFGGKDLIGFLDLRLQALSHRLSKPQAAPLLACPTHRPGWIEVGELARRLTWYQEKNIEPDSCDFIQALLRLAPDGRSETLAASSHLQGKQAAALRYALGGPLEDQTLSAPLLIAAGRARTPLADLPELAPLVRVSGPDALEAAHYAWFVDHLKPEDQPAWALARTLAETARVSVSIGPAIPPMEKVHEMPTVLQHAWSIRHFGLPGSRESVHRWAASVWPANLDPFFTAGVDVPDRRFMLADLLRQRALFLEPLFDPDVPFREIAQVLLAIGLTQKEPEVAGTAVDVLIELIRDGRCIGPELGSVLGRMLPAGLIKLNRLGNRLDQVARASVWHMHVCARLMQVACSVLTEVPRDVHQVLSPLLEWLTALEQALDDSCRSVVSQIKSGKSGTLAKKLLQLSGSANKQHEILMHAFQSRMERATRWANATP